MENTQLQESSQESPSQLTTEDVHEVLSNKRRRLTLELLQNNDGEMTARELSECIAATETGEDPPPRNIRQSAYVSLLQTHLPRLNQYGIIKYDSDSKRVELRDGIDQVAVYMATVPKYGLSWSELYAGLAILGGLTVSGSQIGVPILTSVPAVSWAYFFLGLICVSGLYQMYQQGSSLIHRMTS